KIGREQKTLLLALGAEVIRLAIEAAGEIALGVEDKIDVAIKVEHLRAKGGRNIARRLLAGAVEMLVPAIERNGEHGAFLPLERHARAGVIPHAGRPAPAQHKDHFVV